MELDMACTCRLDYFLHIGFVVRHGCVTRETVSHSAAADIWGKRHAPVFISHRTSTQNYYRDKFAIMITTAASREIEVLKCYIYG